MKKIISCKYPFGSAPIGTWTAVLFILAGAGFSLGGETITSDEAAELLCKSITFTTTERPVPFDAPAHIRGKVSAAVVQAFVEPINRAIFVQALARPVAAQSHPELLSLICQRQVITTRLNYELLTAYPPLDDQQQHALVAQIRQWSAKVEGSLTGHLASAMGRPDNAQVRALAKDRVENALIRRLADPLSYQCKQLVPEETMRLDLEEYDRKLVESSPEAARRVREARDPELTAQLFLSEAVTTAVKIYASRSTDEARRQAAGRIQKAAMEKYGDLVGRIRELESKLAAPSPATTPSGVIHP